jgi:hypothetical protein
MSINNNIAITNSPIKTGNSSQLKKNDKTSETNEVTSIAKPAIPNQFSLVLSKQQEDSINDSLGYDQPSGKQRNALDAYRDVAMQEKRDEIIDSMSFHFVV